MTMPMVYIPALSIIAGKDFFEQLVVSWSAIDQYAAADDHSFALVSKFE